MLPVFVVSSTFFVFDPFKILYNYGEQLFVENGTLDGFTLNRDYVGTEMFLQKKDNFNYDSFVFGSSRSSVFQSWEWEKHIENKSVPFHFIGSGESLFGIWSKIKFLDQINHSIKNALLVVDHELLSQEKNGEGVIAIRHPITSNEKIKFYATHFTEYISTDFFIQYLDFKLFGKKKKYMDKLFDNDTRGMVFDNYKNDWIHKGKEEAIKKDSIAYYEQKKKIFYQRPDKQENARIVLGKSHKMMLNEISNVLKKNQTNFKIIINPLYDQKSINKQDLTFISTTFGDSNVYDFSGKNEFTSVANNYYEASHFKPFIARKIMKKIYNDDNY